LHRTPVHVVTLAGNALQNTFASKLPLQGVVVIKCNPLHRALDVAVHRQIVATAVLHPTFLSAYLNWSLIFPNIIQEPKKISHCAYTCNLYGHEKQDYLYIAMKR
tara:strand:+ start:2487 stop:2801 length:315 start_codon:yes stop_codon:yes gene_type:complete